MRGKRPRQRRQIVVAGSSPRMRGKLQLPPKLHHGIRFIPAHVGKTNGGGGARAGGAVHPRACGENDDAVAMLDGSDGSSPRMRGKLQEHLQLPQCQRFIPAHAGKTEALPEWQGHLAVHPRACGENWGIWADQAPAYGSSPRMRGKPPDPAQGPAGLRFIPAHAGKTRPPETSCPRWMVHPRACGENSAPGARAEADCGSSPRMRGKRHGVPHRCRGSRFIPAHAGKTRRPRAAPGPPSVHPRACGENDVTPAADKGEAGSSPRMRGKREGAADDDAAHRFIPAHAGKTGGPSPAR